MRKHLNIATALVIAGYVLLCAVLYLRQGGMLFPADLAPPISADWQPSAGDAHQQAMLDGRCGKLHAVIWRVVGEKGMVMVFHGNGENMINVEREVPMFHRLGYSVMAWDYPGYGLSTGCAFSEDDLLNDADTAFKWLAAQHLTSPVVLYGNSIGTGLALYIASRHPHREVLLVSPYDALVNVVKDHVPFFVPVALLIHYPLHADDWIKQVGGPIHAIHGLNDDTITPERASALINQSEGRADIVWVEDVGHSQRHLFEKRPDWLGQYLH